MGSLPERWRVPALVGTVSVLAFGASSIGAAQAPPKCFGKTATIVGTNGDDNRVGTQGPDVIVALRGNDRGSAGAKAEISFAAIRDATGWQAKPAETDSTAGAAMTPLLGGPGSDVCRGGPGTDTAAECEVTTGIP